MIYTSHMVPQYYHYIAMTQSPKCQRNVTFPTFDTPPPHGSAPSFIWGIIQVHSVTAAQTPNFSMIASDVSKFLW